MYKIWDDVLLSKIPYFFIIISRNEVQKNEHNRAYKK